MNKEFIPYEQALVLKELGFDEECVGYYHEPNLMCFTEIKQENLINGAIVAPLYQQAFRWFRERYNLMPFVDRSYMNLYEFRIVEKAWGYTASTYEEAELACLNKLIEIVKRGNK